MNLLGCVLAASMLFSLTRVPELQKKVDSDSRKAQEGSADTQTPPVANNDSDYRIGPQDILRIDVWKEEQLTRTVPVRPDGKVTLPLLNDVHAAGLTPMQLSQAIGGELKKFITNPQVTVTVMEINSRRIYVTGEVLRSGAYPMLPKMTVLQALSGSGGFTQFARTKKIYVLRTEQGKQTKLPFNYNEVLSGKRAEQNIVLEPGDVIVVP
jgi:polysaccharide biosynthesis/export protein